MENDLLLKLLLSGVAASVAETATYPLDLLKTRLQLAGQLGQAAPVTLPSVVRAEGLLALYKGLAPAVLRHFPYTGIRIVAFEQLSMFSRRRLGCEEPGSILPLPVSLMLGLTAGGVAQLVAVPADLVKVRMQADGRLVAAGLQAAPRWACQLPPVSLLAPMYMGQSLRLSTAAPSTAVVGLHDCVSPIGVMLRQFEFWAFCFIIQTPYAVPARLLLSLPGIVACCMPLPPSSGSRGRQACGAAACQQFSEQRSSTLGN